MSFNQQISDKHQFTCHFLLRMWTWSTISLQEAWWWWPLPLFSKRILRHSEFVSLNTKTNLTCWCEKMLFWLNRNAWLSQRLVERTETSKAIARFWGFGNRFSRPRRFLQALFRVERVANHIVYTLWQCHLFVLHCMRWHQPWLS